MTDYTPDNEPEVITEYDFGDNADVEVQTLAMDSCEDQLMQMALIACSRQPDKQYEIGQCGDREFTHTEYLTFAYRLEVPCSDKQLRTFLNKSIRTGLYLRTTRNHYVASTLMQYSFEAIKAESTRLLSRPVNPTKR